MLTKHGQKRAQQRKGFSPTAAERRFQEALEYGRTAADFPPRSPEGDYLLCKSSHGGAEAIAFDGICYIAAGDVCITIFNLPQWFDKKHYDGKNQIRDLKTYIRHYGSERIQAS